MGQCSSHSDCIDWSNSGNPWAHPDDIFCYKGSEFSHLGWDAYCTQCFQCNTCSDGIDNTCGTCGTGYPVTPESHYQYADQVGGLRCWSDSDCNVCGQAAQSCCSVEMFFTNSLKICKESCSGDAVIGSPRVLNTEYIYSGQQLVIIVLAALSLLTIFGVICNCLRSRCGVMRHEQKYQAVSMDRTVAEESESEQVGFKDEAI